MKKNTQRVKFVKSHSKMAYFPGDVVTLNSDYIKKYKLITDQYVIPADEDEEQEKKEKEKEPVIYPVTPEEPAVITTEGDTGGNPDGKKEDAKEPKK